MEKNTKRKNTFLSFGVGKETFAVSVSKVLEVLEKQYVTEIPNVPSYIKGVINFRGNIIPVIETRTKFNMTDRNKNEKYVIIVFDLKIEDKKTVIGAITDKVNDVLTFDHTAIQNVPELGLKYNTEFIEGMIKNNEGFTMILNIDKVFSKKEVNFINSSADTAADEIISNKPEIEENTPVDKKNKISRKNKK